jgi:hypothetical protein
MLLWRRLLKRLMLHIFGVHKRLEVCEREFPVVRAHWRGILAHVAEEDLGRFFISNPISDHCFADYAMVWVVGVL